MQILLNGRFLTRPLSGVDRVALELFKAMQQVSKQLNGTIVSFCVILPKRYSSRHEEFLQILGECEMRFEGRLDGQLWEQLELPFLTKGELLLNLCTVAPLLKKRQVVMIHDAQPYLVPESYRFLIRTWYKFVLPVISRRSMRVLTVSEYSKEQLVAFRVAEKNKVEVIYNGVDHINRVFEEDGVLDRLNLSKKKYFLALGNLAPHKNLELLMRAASTRCQDSYEMIIVGGINRVFGDAKLKSFPGVRLVGRVSDEELKSLYMHAYAFVFPSQTEGFGLPPLEAMACGCPVIASTGGAIPEVCGAAAIYVDPCNEEAWGEKLSVGSMNDRMREDLVARGEQRVASFTWENGAIRLMRLLAEFGGESSLSEQLDELL
ncbi:glycosyltransferase family 4 protein [Coraliomargarita sp. W4R72]